MKLSGPAREILKQSLHHANSKLGNSQIGNSFSTCIPYTAILNKCNLPVDISWYNFMIRTKKKKVFHLWFEISMHHTLKMTKCNHIQYLHNDSLCIIFWVFPTPTKVIQHLVKATLKHIFTFERSRGHIYENKEINRWLPWKYSV